MKKEGIQTRNRKLSSKSKKKKAGSCLGLGGVMGDMIKASGHLDLDNKPFHSGFGSPMGKSKSCPVVASSSAPRICQRRTLEINHFAYSAVSMYKDKRLQTPHFWIFSISIFIKRNREYGGGEGNRPGHSRETHGARGLKGRRFLLSFQVRRSIITRCIRRCSITCITRVSAWPEVFIKDSRHRRRPPSTRTRIPIPILIT